MSAVAVPQAVGLSPLARGNRAAIQDHQQPGGPIPACAGEPVQRIGRHRHSRAYPRLRGGTRRFWFQRRRVRGLSPLARGNPPAVDQGDGRDGPIPACAGEPSAGRCASSVTRAYPRLRGGTVLTDAALARVEGLSPLARGNQSTKCSCKTPHGPIPACAGEPVHQVGGDDFITAYPRLRGGTRSSCGCSLDGGGLSPLARGNPVH